MAEAHIKERLNHVMEWGGGGGVYACIAVL